MGNSNLAPMRYLQQKCVRVCFVFVIILDIFFFAPKGMDSIMFGKHRMNVINATGE